MSESADEHQCHLRLVFERLRHHGLTINVNKCNFGQSEVQFLGYIINGSGCRPPTDRVTVITNYTKPETICELRRFLGVINYYRRSYHNKGKMFILKDFHDCTHVFLRTDAVRGPLQTPYTGPYKMENDVNVSADRLKSAFIINDTQRDTNSGIPNTPPDQQSTNFTSQGTSSAPQLPTATNITQRSPTPI
ncbi:uncharacterized protein LOC135955580 [Calliphora vicina]|uniref:uncharacterized protein LOC135955580 n=1 Tax=Calliphora vicina TaxID=7373 RepID=UPI00325A8517